MPVNSVYFWYNTLLTMRKEWVNNLFVVGAEAFLGINGKYPLTQRGRETFSRACRQILRCEPLAFSQASEVLDGYKINISGQKVLEALKNKPFLLAGNHTTEGPISGFWQIFAVSRAVRETTGQELHWVQGVLRSSISNGRLPFVNGLFEKISESTGTILVGNGKHESGKARRIPTTLRGDGSVAFYPEGTTSKRLVRADPNAGRTILLILKHNIPVFCFSGYPSGPCSLELIFSEGPDYEVIKESTDEEKNKTKLGQDVADYTMRLIARFLPEELRGAYA